MSSIVRDASGAWRGRFRDPDGHQRSRNFVRKIDAEQFLTSVEHAKFSGAYVDPSAGRTTFREYAEERRAIQIHRPSTAAQVETNFRLHVFPYLGDRPLAAIRPSEIQAWVRSRSGVLKPRTVELLYRYVVAVLRSAVSDRLIAVNPAIGIKLPKPEVQRVVPLETSVVERLIEVVPDHYRALVVLAAGTGMRQGECFGLTVDRVDFLRRQVTVDRQMLLMPGGGPAFAPPKTQASYRVVPLPQIVVDVLASHIAQYPSGASGLVFTNARGEAIHRTRFSDDWRPAVKLAGAPAGTGFHALRHYYASLLIRHGESVKVVQARLGHASATETLDTYSHLWPDSEDQTRAAVDGVLLAAVSDLCQMSVRN
jgi:integrase